MKTNRRIEQENPFPHWPYLCTRRQCPGHTSGSSQISSASTSSFFIVLSHFPILWPSFPLFSLHFSPFSFTLSSHFFRFFLTFPNFLLLLYFLLLLFLYFHLFPHSLFFSTFHSLIFSFRFSLFFPFTYPIFSFSTPSSFISDILKSIEVYLLLNSSRFSQIFTTSLPWKSSQISPIFPFSS